MTIKPEASSTVHKNSVTVATTANITLSGLQTIDGVALVAGDRVLVKNQATASQNGIYVVASGAWTRAKDADQNEEVKAGLQLAVAKGTTLADTVWLLTTDDPIVVGTTSLAFLQIAGLGAGLSGALPVDVDAAAAAVGASGLGSRADHKHSVPTGVAGTIAVGDAASAGVATSLSRSDHAHAFPAPAAPANVTKAAASAGVATTAARADHKHDVDTAAPVSVGNLSNVEGTSTALARADHAHRASVRTQNAGSFVADEPVINNTGSAFFTDDAGNDRVNFNAARITVNTPTSLAIGDAAAVGVSTLAATDDHVHAFPAPAAPANVTKAAAATGSSTAAARADHKHDVDTAAPGAVAVGDAASEGVATSLARADHVHGFASPAAPANVTKAAASAGVATTAARADHKHDVDTAVPVVGAVAVGNVASEGVATSLARSDHTHTVTGAAPVSVDTAANAEGVATTFARSDHKHAASTAVVGAIAVGDAAAEGIAASLARSDHTHSLAAPAAPADVTKAAASAGVATTVARADHKHDVSTAAAASIGTANSEGTATSLARSDHGHDHGSQSTSTHHAVAIAGGNNGFLSGTDKQKLDNAGGAFSGSVQTTDATVTTLASYTPADDTVVTVLVRVTGRNGTGPQGAGYLLSASFRRTAGTITQIGTTSALATHEDDGAWDATIDGASGDVRVRVTGVAATTIDWDCNGQVTISP